MSTPPTPPTPGHGPPPGPDQGSPPGPDQGSDAGRRFAGEPAPSPDGPDQVYLSGPTDEQEYVPVSPVLPEDPPRIGDFWLDARLGAHESGVAFTGHSDDGRPVMLLQLSEGAAADAAARDRLAGVVNQLHIDTVIARGGHGQDFGRLARKYRAEDDDPVAPDAQPVAPWVALAYDGSPAAAAEAERILAEVQLAGLPPQGRPAGPDFHHYWIDRIRPGLSRMWPLPWPGRFDRAGWPTILVSWLLMMLLAALGVLIAILIFRNQPPQTPPTPTGGSGSPPPATSSPQSGSPPPQSGSPSPQSGSPSGSPSGSESASASPSPSGSQSGPSGPTPSDSGAPAPPSPGSRL